MDLGMERVEVSFSLVLVILNTNRIGKKDLKLVVRCPKLEDDLLVRIKLYFIYFERCASISPQNHFTP